MLVWLLYAAVHRGLGPDHQAACLKTRGCSQGLIEFYRSALWRDKTHYEMRKKSGDLVPATLAHSENWSCRAASFVAVANVEILWNAWRRQKASASAPKKKKKEPYHEASLLMHSHSCCLQRADCLCDLPLHVSVRFLFTERHGTFHHTGICLCFYIVTLARGVSISTWSKKS